MDEPFHRGSKWMNLFIESKWMNLFMEEGRSRETGYTKKNLVQNEDGP